MEKNDNSVTSPSGYSETDNLLLSLAREFINPPPEEIEPRIQSSLEKIVQITKTDRGYIFLFSNNCQNLNCAYQFNQSDIKEKIAHHERVDSPDFSWLVETIRNGSIIKINALSDLPAQASTIKIIMMVEKIKSMILHPLEVNDSVVGYIGLDSVENERVWSKNDEYLLSISGDIFIKAMDGKKPILSRDQSNKRLNSLCRQSEDVFFVSTPDGKIIEINPAGLKLFGYASLEELEIIDIGNDLYLEPRLRDEFKRLIESQGFVKDFELHLKTKDNRNIIVLETAKLVYDENGHVTSYEGIMRDVSEKRHLEQQLFQSQKMESIGLMAGGIAHDFNNILTAINGYSDLILHEMDASNPHYNRIVSILKAGKRAEKLIKQLLAFSRKQPITPKVHNINLIITDLYKMLRRLVREDIQLELDLADDISNIIADPVQIQQILVNLVVNAGYAIKDLDSNSVSKCITIISSDTILTKEFVSQNPGSKEGKYIVISVKDTGIGMSKDIKNKIFEPFFTTRKENTGTGLGLSTVYGIIKQNNSNIYVESEPNKGSVFNIYWPVTEKQKKPDTKLESVVEFGDRLETILFVEDDYDIRNLVVPALRNSGYTIIEAENGIEALEKVHKDQLIKKIDLLVSDMVMPEMGGEQLAENLTALNPGLKVLLCSGYNESQIIFKETQDMENYQFIAKPYTILKLEKKIQKALSTVRINK